MRSSVGARGKFPFSCCKLPHEFLSCCHSFLDGRKPFALFASAVTRKFPTESTLGINLNASVSRRIGASEPVILSVDKLISIQEILPSVVIPHSITVINLIRPFSFHNQIGHAMRIEDTIPKSAQDDVSLGTLAVGHISRYSVGKIARDWVVVEVSEEPLSNLACCCHGGNQPRLCPFVNENRNLKRVFLHSNRGWWLWWASTLDPPRLHHTSVMTS